MTDIGKVMVTVYSFFGIIFLALPGSILGTGLALKIQEDEKTEVYRVPAAKLIQSVWRSYSTNQNTSSSPFWKLYQRSDGSPLTQEDRSCIRFIRLVIYMKQRKRFKTKFGSIKDDFFAEKTTREMTRRLESLSNDIRYVTKMNSDKSVKNLHQSQQLIKRLKDKFNELKAKTKSDNNNEEKDSQKTREHEQDNKKP